MQNHIQRILKSRALYVGIRFCPSFLTVKISGMIGPLRKDR